MITKITTVYDSKAKFYGRPLPTRTTEEAIRNFATIVNDPHSPYYPAPEDFTLFEMGTFDDETAKLELHENLIPISNGAELVQKAES